MWLASAEARALTALNRPEEAHTDLARATDLRDQVHPDELDGLGGTCTSSRPRQLYFAAEALSWGGQPEATRVERLALEALDDYARRVGCSSRLTLALRCERSQECDGYAVPSPTIPVCPKLGCPS